MAGRYYDQNLAFLIELRTTRQGQLLKLQGQSQSIGAAGYSKSTTGFTIEQLTADLRELEFEIKRQTDLESGTNTRPTCSHVSFAYDTER